MRGSRRFGRLPAECSHSKPLPHNRTHGQEACCRYLLQAGDLVTGGSGHGGRLPLPPAQAPDMLTQTVFRSEDLPVADRFDAWCEIMGRVQAPMKPMKMTSEFAADFQARLRCIPLGKA